MVHDYKKNLSDKQLQTCEICIDKLLDSLDNPLDMVQRINLPDYVKLFYTSINVRLPLEPQIGEDIANNVVKYAKELISKTTDVEYKQLIFEKINQIEEKISQNYKANQITFRN